MTVIRATTLVWLLWLVSQFYPVTYYQLALVLVLVGCLFILWAFSISWREDIRARRFQSSR